MRPADVFYLRGDSSRAQEELGWKPKTSFEEMVRKMINNDLKLLRPGPYYSPSDMKLMKSGRFKNDK